MKDLNAGSTFQMRDGQGQGVYLASEVPADEVLGLKTVEGLKLKKDVKAGKAIRKGDFEKGATH